MSEDWRADHRKLMAQLDKTRRLLDAASAVSLRLRREAEKTCRTARECIDQIQKQPVDLVVYRTARIQKKKRAG